MQTILTSFRAALLLMLLCSPTLWAQQQNVSGTVKNAEGNSIPKVSVREIDQNRRVFNQTRADQNGLFSFKVRDAQHALQFYAPGYRTMVHKMLGAKNFSVTLERRRVSPYADRAKVLLKSDKLICGHYKNERVPQQAWLEKMTDTLYAIIIPVRMERMIDEYPAGRQLILLDELGRQTMQCENVVDAYPIAGDPKEISQNSITQSGALVSDPKDYRYELFAQSRTDTGHLPGGSDDDEQLYAYPHFQLSRAQLEQICADPSLMARLAVDTYRANNYWNFFPTEKTITLIKKALTK